MSRALTIAERGLGRTTPNPVVGACVVTDEGVAVGRGSHRRAGEPHAEVNALEAAGARSRGATLYCTLEPCVHIGRTGPCTDRIIDAGIRRVVAAVEDPDPRVSGRGVAILRSHGIQVDVGLCRDEAVRLNQPFFTTIRRGRPFVILKVATSLDARVSIAAGERTTLTSNAANRRAHLMRARVDALAVGSGTILVDDPVLTSRAVFRERPLARVVFDRRLRTPPDARVLSTLSMGPVIVLTSSVAATSHPDRVRALEHAGATVTAVAEPGLAPMLASLCAFDIQSVLLEGGPCVHAAAWDEGVVDYVQLFVAPVTLGPAGLPLPEPVARSIPSLVEAQVGMWGADAIIEGYVHRPD